MFARHDLFILAAVVADDVDGASVLHDVAMSRIEDTARDAVRAAGQRLIEANLAAGVDPAEMLLDVRFSADRAGALAALER
jgi:hypothetical protein